jgi:hypothetical protein
VEILGDISHHHSGDDHQRAGKCVGEKADPCELDAIAVSHDWPVNRSVKRIDNARGGQILCITVTEANVYSENDEIINNTK